MVSTLPQRLRHARSLAELPARELDRLADIPQGHSWIIESRTSENLETDTARALARVLGVSLDWLITGEGKEPTRRAVRAAVEVARAAWAAERAAKKAAETSGAHKVVANDVPPKRSTGTR